VRVAAATARTKAAARGVLGTRLTRLAKRLLGR
jgi:hypothetical protein